MHVYKYTVYMHMHVCKRGWAARMNLGTKEQAMEKLSLQREIKFIIPHCFQCLVF